jgi:hypothetical protein
MTSVYLNFSLFEQAGFFNFAKHFLYPTTYTKHAGISLYLAAAAPLLRRGKKSWIKLRHGRWLPPSLLSLSLSLSLSLLSLSIPTLLSFH